MCRRVPEKRPRKMTPAFESPPCPPPRGTSGDRPKEGPDGAVEEADGRANEADGGAQVADGGVEEADGRAEEADGGAEEADHVATQEEAKEIAYIVCA